MAPALTNSESFDGLLARSQNVIASTTNSTLSMNENVSTVGSKNPSTLRPRAVSGPREENLARRRFQKGQLLLLKKRWSVRFYEDVIENGERQRKRVQRFLGTLVELPTKRLALRAMDETLAAVNSLAYRPRTTTTFREFAKQWVEKCPTRKRKPIKPSTLCNWESILNNHLLPVLGSTPLSSVDNRAMKLLVEGLVRKGLRPQTVKNVVQVAKLVKASAIDENGNELFPTKWNHEFIDLPEVDETKQRKPSFLGEQVTKIREGSEREATDGMCLARCFGSSAGELLALEIRHFEVRPLKLSKMFGVARSRIQRLRMRGARLTCIRM